MKHLLHICIVFISISGCTEDEVDPIIQHSCFNIEPDAPVADHENALSESEMDNYYLIWRDEVKERNNLLDSEIDEHYKHVVASSNAWNNGISFRVDYVYVYDWIEVKSHDKFIVQLNNSSNSYQHLNIPRDVLLDEEWVKFVIDTSIWQSKITPIIKNVELNSKNCQGALNALKEASGYNQFVAEKISFYVPGKSPREDGYPYLIAGGTIKNDENRCLTGYYNLVTGDFSARETVCYVIN